MLKAERDLIAQTGIVVDAYADAAQVSGGRALLASVLLSASIAWISYEQLAMVRIQANAAKIQADAAKVQADITLRVIAMQERAEQREIEREAARKRAEDRASRKSPKADQSAQRP